MDWTALGKGGKRRRRLTGERRRATADHRRKAGTAFRRLIRTGLGSGSMRATQQNDLEGRVRELEAGQGRSTASGGSDYAGELSRARGNKREGKPGRRQALPCWEASAAAWASRRVTERRRKGGNQARFRQWRLELGFWQAGRRRLRFRV